MGLAIIIGPEATWMSGAILPGFAVVLAAIFTVDRPQWLVHSGFETALWPLAGTSLIFAPMIAWFGLKRATWRMRVTPDRVIVTRGADERARVQRRDLVQVTCRWRVKETTVDGHTSLDLCFDLVALDANGSPTVLIEDAPRAHALFAEVWLESILGIPDHPVQGEIITPK